MSSALEPFLAVSSIRDCIVSTKEKAFEKSIFGKIPHEITILKSGKRTYVIVLKSCVRNKKRARWLELSKVFNRMKHSLLTMSATGHMQKTGLSGG